MNRQEKIFQAILDSFLLSAEPVGSKAISEEFELGVSAATVRSEMASLEEKGLIVQPHISAGRIPTAKGWRFFVDRVLEDRIQNQQKKSVQRFEKEKKKYMLHKVRERVYDAVAVLSNTTPNVCFATLPGNNHTFYVGLSNILKQPEFATNLSSASQVVEVLEHNFLSKLNDLDIGEDRVRIYIGEENFLPQIKSCSLLALRYSYNEYQGVLGILGPMRMEYAHNTVSLRMAQEMIQNI